MNVRDAKPSVASRLALLLVLVITASISLAWSHVKLLHQDELFVLQTDSMKTLHEVVQIQLHHPISLDPLVYHAIAHEMTRVFGVTPFALRLPSLLGYLLMQLCLFVFVWRATKSGRAGVLAAAFPALTATLYYSTEGRPYGILLGLYALTLLCYQAASRNLDERKPRTLALVGLGLSIALALNTHYFAVLLLIPVCGAELARIAQRRHIDWPVASAIVLGMACIVFTLPFQKAVRTFRLNYYNIGKLNFHAITQSYRSLLIDYVKASLRIEHLLALFFVLIALVFLAALAARWRTFHLSAGESIFLLMLAALPVFGYLLAKFVTHSYEVRYVIGAIIGIAALIAVLLAPSLEKTAMYSTVMGTLLLLIVLFGVIRIRSEARDSKACIAALQAIPPMVHEELAADPSARLYIQNLGYYELAQYYQPDPMIRSRLTLLYSAPLEIQIDKHDTEALTAEHMQSFTPLSIMRYKDLRSTHKPLFLVMYYSGWDFTPEALAQDHASVQTIGPWFGGTMARVVFP